MPCALSCVLTAVHSQVLLLPQGAERKKTQMWGCKGPLDGLFLPCQFLLSTELLPQGSAREGSVPTLPLKF